MQVRMAVWVMLVGCQGVHSFQPETLAEPSYPTVQSLEVFYGGLNERGSWHEDREHGWVFIPDETDYQPYRDGYWETTEHGAVWYSDEPFAWATYHYGSWAYRERWMWVPGLEWRETWVEWTVSERTVSWAPVMVHAQAAPAFAWTRVQCRAVGRRVERRDFDVRDWHCDDEERWFHRGERRRSDADWRALGRLDHAEQRRMAAAPSSYRERKEHAERAMREREERERAESAARELTERVERERLERERAERMTREREERDRVEKAAREVAERTERERLEKERVERATRERDEKERTEKAARELTERTEKERLEKERAEREPRQLDKERTEFGR